MVVNTLGEVPTFSYTSQGQYNLNTVAALFTSDNKVFCDITQPDITTGAVSASINRNTTTQLKIYTSFNGSLFNNILTNDGAWITIIIYP